MVCAFGSTVILIKTARLLRETIVACILLLGVPERKARHTQPGSERAQRDSRPRLPAAQPLTASTS